MRPPSRFASVAVALGALVVAAACSSSTSSPGSTVLGATGAPADNGAGNGPVVLSMRIDPLLGSYLLGPNQMTLYVYTKDSPGKSNCTGNCATAWPPLLAPNGAQIQGPVDATLPFGTVARSDGSLQVTYDDMPLYFYRQDSSAGDAKGQGVGGVWFVASLSGSVSSTAPSAGTPPVTGASDAPLETPAPAATPTDPGSSY
jgi:predicted lipoprotein with Yx(FWY)xxD motif